MTTIVSIFDRSAAVAGRLLAAARSSAMHPDASRPTKVLRGAPVAIAVHRILKRPPMSDAYARPVTHSLRHRGLRGQSTPTAGCLHRRACERCGVRALLA